MSELSSDSSFQQYVQATENRWRRSDDDDSEDEPEVFYDKELVDITDYRPMYSIMGQVAKTTGFKLRKGLVDNKFGNKSLLLRRVIYEDPSKVPTIRLEIQSDTLQQWFRDTTSGLTTINVNRNPIMIDKPFKEVFWFREQIDKAIADTHEPDLKAELKLLKEFEREYMKTSITDITTFKNTGRISLEYLWALFRPGEIIVLQNTKASWATVSWCATVKSFEYLVTKGAIVGWQLVYWWTGFDGRKFGRMEGTETFGTFSDVVEIASLPAFPLGFHADENRLKETLIRDGREYQRLCQDSLPSRDLNKFGRTGAHRRYAGPLWTARSPFESRDGCRFYDAPSHEIRSRVVVDPVGFVGEFPSFRDTITAQTTHDRVASDDSSISSFHFSFHSVPSIIEIGETVDEESQDLSDELLMTCPPLIAAFSFSLKRWGLILVRGVKDIQWEGESFGHLQLGETYKTIIKRVVTGHQSRRQVPVAEASERSENGPRFDDFISSKGRGLVFLLHGPPGTGKTMTAESIAECVQSPLYSVTGGELGTHVEQVEEVLRVVFSRINRWKAFLLIDEADTFMAQRRDDSIDRNALISVLLRQLEYQSGIIFLTSNRIEDFDTAFHSRIHMTIEYKPLIEDQRQQIWRGLVTRAGWSFSDEEYAKLATLPIDGRVIKNILGVVSNLVKDRADGGVTFEDVRMLIPLMVVPKDNKDLAAALEKFSSSQI